MSRAHLKRWGAVWIFAAMWAVSVIGQFVATVYEVTNAAHDHGSVFMWSDFWPSFAAKTFENWQSEFLQLLFQTILIQSVLAAHVFRASQAADKQDVARILTAIRTSGRGDA